MDSDLAAFLRHRGSLALNNLGVSLMDRAHLRDALLCFKEAFALSTGTDEGTRGMQENSSACLARHIDTKMQVASVALINASSDPPASELRSFPWVMKSLRLSAVSDDPAVLACCVSSPIMLSNVSLVVHPIRIDLDEEETSIAASENGSAVNNQTSLSIASCWRKVLQAVMLHNMGTAMFCLAHTLTTPLSQSENFLQLAIQLLQSASYIVTSVLVQDSERNFLDDDCHSHWSCLHLIILRTLLPLFFVLDMPHEVFNCTARVLELSNDVTPILKLYAAVSVYRCAGVA